MSRAAAPYGLFYVPDPPSPTPLPNSVNGRLPPSAPRVPRAVVTTNSGCLMRIIKTSLSSAGCEVLTMHVAEVLDLPIRGVNPKEWVERQV